MVKRNAEEAVVDADKKFQCSSGKIAFWGQRQAPAEIIFGFPKSMHS